MELSKSQIDALYRTNLACFTQRVFNIVDPGAKYSHNWHINLMCEYLEAAERGDIKRLIINIPPRMMKSICVSVAWPAWLLGRAPRRRIMAASYSEKLALKHSTDCRLVVRSDWYRNLFPHVMLTDDMDTKAKFTTTERGHRIATSVGGTATGEGGNFLIVDDPHNPMQAASETQRKSALDWFDQTFVTRLDDVKDGVIVVIMQRLHENDLTGHLLEKGGWTHCCLPLIAEEKTICDFGRVKKTRERGELLHSARIDSFAADSLRNELGSAAFAGQYQQRPAPMEGTVFKVSWLQNRYTKPKESYKRVIQSWDTAVKASQLNDPSCCITIGEHETGYDVLDVKVRRLEYPDLKALVFAQADAWSPNAVLIEDKASGQQLLQDLKRETKLPLIAIKPTADKVTRAAACSALVESGRLFLPSDAPWLADFEHELLTFPACAHDDQTDALTQFLNWTREHSAKQKQFVIRL